MAYRRWKPSKAQAKEFHETMEAINVFCNEHGISSSNSSDSYYFTVDGVNYRVSNHSVESSFAHSGGMYHSDGRRDDTVYIHASKTRIVDIYNDLKAGYKLNGNGYRI